MASGRMQIPILLVALAAVGAGIYWTRSTPGGDSEQRARWQIRQEPANPEGYVKLADILFQQSDSLEASAASATDPAVAMARHNQANQTTDEAISLYRKVLDLAPDNVAVANSLGQVYLQQRRFQAAKDVLSAAVKRLPEKSPDEAVLRKTLATALLYNDERDAAELQLDKVLQLKPDYAEAILDKAMRHADRNEWPEAKTLIFKAMKLQPENPEVHNKLALLYFNMGQYEDALAPMQLAIKEAAKPDLPPYYITLGQIYRKLHRPKDALAAFSEAVKRSPRSVLGLTQIGETFHDMGLDHTAIEYFRAAMGADPENADVAGRLAEIFCTSKDQSCQDLISAVFYAERAVEISKGSRLQLLRLLAQIYAECHRFQDAINTAEKAEKLGLLLGYQTDVEKIRLAKEEYVRGLAKFPVPPSLEELKAATTAPATGTAPASLPATLPATTSAVK